VLRDSQGKQKSSSRRRTTGAAAARDRRREAHGSTSRDRSDPASKRARRRPSLLRGVRLPRWLLPLAVFGAVGFLYVRPITTYLETREQLAERRTEVATLRAERARVTARLERATSLEELARSARRIGYVRPDEHLFIVKGTAAWSREHSR
jgi:cell division protein FtsB